MLLAAIDIGSNAVRLFFSNVIERDQQIIIEKESLLRVPLRLGEEAFLLGKIPEHKILKLIKTIKAFRLLIDVYQPVAYRAVATSAIREVKNREAIVRRIASKTGINIEIIDGVKEARIVSAIKSFGKLNEHTHSMFIDVGGGSTEISIMSEQGLIDLKSFKIGTVRLLRDQVKKKEWAIMREWLNDHKKLFDNMIFVAAGGSINKIARLYGRVNDNTLPYNNLEYAIKELERFSLRQRIELMGLKPDRADVILPAANIYHYIMKSTKAQYIYVPKIGLCDGVVSMLYREISEGKQS